ncbi:MAG: acetate--CoA ligase family protein [Methanobacteriota archaeon]|nr:MAG: acetate--CoA ligase family protein [Euryarchaeota archaeon]
MLEQQNSRSVLREDETKSLLKEHKIPTTNFIVVEDGEQLESVPFPFPLVAKVCSKEILHKTDVEGVVLDIKDRDELNNAIDELRRRFPNKALLVEHMEEGEVELIIGVVNDSVFGPTIMFGLGGVLAELYKDVTFRTMPISDYDAEEMMSEIKGAKLLEGFRGIRIDRTAIKNLLLNVSKMADDMKDRVEQLDLNPVLAREDGLIVVDAKIVLSN